MSPMAAALVNWNDLWKIILTALVGGTGVVIVFALLLLGISRGKTATKPTARYGLYTLSGVCGILVVAVAAIGIYAMTQKPSSTKPKPKAAATDTRSSQPTRTTGRQDYLNRGDDHALEQAATA
jgi:NADH:ubiquinone oxidoreductase subunit 6 (subunit J)